MCIFFFQRVSIKLSRTSRSFTEMHNKIISRLMIIFNNNLVFATRYYAMNVL